MAFRSQAQNLVPNPGFETVVNCPDNHSQLSRAAGWAPPTDGTSDYFHTCSTYPWTNVLNNMTGSETPHSGNAYAGFFAYGCSGTKLLAGEIDTNVREYLQIRLTAPLVPGQRYNVRFFVSLGDGFNGNGEIDVATDDIGACFSVGPIQRFSPSWFGTTLPIVRTPQVRNPEGNFLSVTDGWMEISGCLIADSAYEYITLGCFKSSDISLMHVNNSFPLSDMSYYYIDDISVTPGLNATDIIGGDTIICNGTPASLLVISGGAPLWSTGAGANAIQVAMPGEYSVQVLQDGCIYTDTVEVLSLSIAPDAGPDRSTCDEDELVLGTLSPDPRTTYRWSTGAATPTLTVNQNGTYWIEQSVGTCAATDTVQVEMLFTPDAELGSDTVLCENASILLDAGFDEASHTFTWSTGEITRIITVGTPGTITLTVANSCGADTDILEVLNGGDCVCPVYIPAAFTPNGNNVNETFGPVSACRFSEFEFSVYNRWGKCIFRTTDPGVQWTADRYPSDVYAWKLSYRPEAPMMQTRAEQTGKVAVIR